MSGVFDRRCDSSAPIHTFFYVKYVCSFQEMWDFQAKPEHSTATQPRTGWCGMQPLCQAGKEGDLPSPSPPLHCFTWESFAFTLLGIGWLISCTHMGKNYEYIYIYTLLEQPSSEETKVWWTDQNAWASMRPLNTYAEGAEAVVLCSPQFGSTEKLFQSSYPWGKKSHTKTCYERWVGSDVVNTCLNLQQCHTSASVGGKWSRPWKQIVPKPKDIRYVACIKLFLFNDAVVKHQYWCDPWTTVFRSSADHSKCHNPLQKGSFS